MIRRLKPYILMLTASLSLIFMPAAANAGGYLQLKCNTNGTVAGGELFYADPGAGACEYTGSIQHIFSQIICNFVTILNVVLGRVYCGMQAGLSQLVLALLTLYVAVFGVQVMMGTAHLNAREIVIRAIKIGAVSAFVSQSALGIGIIFQFFTGVMTDGALWAIAGLNNAVNAGTGIPWDTSGSDIMPAYAYIDNMIYNAIAGPFTKANSKVLGLFASMAVAFPPLFLMVLYWLKTTVMLLARTLISFMLGLSAVAFLISLSPLFLSCMLFRTTFHFFETWLRYLTSFSLQIVIVFAIVGMWIAIMSYFVDFFSYLSNVTFYWGDMPKAGAMVDPHEVWGICPFYETTDLIGNPELACNNASFDPRNIEQDRENAIKPAEFAQFPEFIYVVIYNLIALILISHAFNVLLQKAPMLAVAIVGPDSAPMMISPGWGKVGYGGITGSPNRSGWFNRRHNVADGSRAAQTNRLYASTNRGSASAQFTDQAAEMLRRRQQQRS